MDFDINHHLDALRHQLPNVQRVKKIPWPITGQRDSEDAPIRTKFELKTCVSAYRARHPISPCLLFLTRTKQSHQIFYISAQQQVCHGYVFLWIYVWLFTVGYLWAHWVITHRYPEKSCILNEYYSYPKGLFKAYILLHGLRNLQHFPPTNSSVLESTVFPDPECL